MEIDFDTYAQEGQEFLKLRTEFKKSNNPSAGSVGYLMSLSWVNKYKKYIQYDMLRRNLSANPNALNDVEMARPG